MPQEPLNLADAVVLAGSFMPPVTGDTRKKTLAQLRDRLDRALGKPVDVSNIDLDGWINDAVTELTSMVRLVELQDMSYSFVLTPDEPVYRLPPGVGPLRAVKVSGATDTFKERVLLPTDWHGWQNLAPYAGHVEQYFRQGNLLAFWPRPDFNETIVLDFQSEPQPLTADDHQLQLDRTWEWPILNLAKWIALSEHGQYESAGAAYNTALASIRSKRSPEADNRQSMVLTASFPRSARELGVQPYESENQ